MDHATPFYSKLKILKIPELYKHKVAKLVFHHYHQRLPPLLSNLYIKTNEVSQKCTRSSSTANILPYTFLFTKQLDFKKASGTKVLKYGTKFQQALKPNNLLIALKYHTKIVY